MARHAEAARRRIERFGTAAFLFTVLDDEYEKALDRAGQMLSRVYNRPFRDAATKYCLLGRPEDCLERMRGFAAAGARHFVLSPLSEPFEFAERVGAAILPELGGLVP
jgi:alkanesulfonate monooxygenase SsuD/methylene tetrahydromethanopterin reductase-like flavin-dependent oxidoreductase (luciferase family)